MRFEFKPSFKRSVKQLPPGEKEDVKKAAVRIIDMLSSGNPIHDKGTGLKHLHADIWEIRKGIKSRILLRLKGETVEFILAGSHDDIKRYLKNL